MVLEFADGTQLTILDIYGGPRDTLGATRDVLSIEFDTNTISFKELREFFMDNPNTNQLFTYVLENGEETKKEIGIGYNICISIAEVRRLIKTRPGTIVKPEIEDLYIVELAQQTYYEYMYENKE